MTEVYSEANATVNVGKERAIVIKTMIVCQDSSAKVKDYLDSQMTIARQVCRVILGFLKHNVPQIWNMGGLF